MNKIRYADALTAAALLTFAGCGQKTATPTPSANVPEVSETPAIQSPDTSALVSPEVSVMPSPVTSPAASTGTATSSPAA